MARRNTNTNVKVEEVTVEELVARVEQQDVEQLEQSEQSDEIVVQVDGENVMSDADNAAANAPLTIDQIDVVGMLSELNGNKSALIRRLSADGFERKFIAKRLMNANILSANAYQHVRNVMLQPLKKG